MKRISSGDIGEIIGGCKEWHEIAPKVAQAQKESCEKEHAKEMLMQEGYLEQAKEATVREIFEEIKDLMHEGTPDKYQVYRWMRIQDWKAFKEKYLK